MIRYYIFKDGTLECSAGTNEAAMDIVRMYQEREQKAHQWLWANFSIITGEEECIPYPKQKRNKKAI